MVTLYRVWTVLCLSIFLSGPTSFAKSSSSGLSPKVIKASSLAISGSPVQVPAPQSADTDAQTTLDAIDVTLATEIKSVAERIATEFPPSEYVYLSLGRSPTPITAYLSLSPGLDVRHVPLSSMSWGTKDWDAGAFDLNMNMNKDLRTHIERFVGDLPKGKRLLLLDYTTTGRSLWGFIQIVSSYLQIKGQTNPIRAIGITGKPIKDKTKPFECYDLNLDSRASAFPIPSDSKLAEWLFDQRFDKLSPVGKYPIGSTKPYSEGENPFYQKLREKLAELSGKTVSCRTLF